MKKMGFAVAAAFAFSFVHPVAALEPLEISWVDLLPEESPLHDPFANLQSQQVSDLADLYRIEVLRISSPSDQVLSRALKIRERLVSQGLDPDQLFEQREALMNERKQASSQLNSDIIGKVVRLPGYLLPLEFDGQKAVEFLLVPSVGACIHTPPPPANQMVLVRYPEGFEAGGLFTPVWISGEMRAQGHSNELYLVDGQAAIDTSYFVEAMSVEIYD